MGSSNYEFRTCRDQRWYFFSKLSDQVFPIKQNDHQATLQFTSSFSTTTSTVTRNSARTFGLNKEAHVAEEAHEHPNMYPLR